MASGNLNPNVVKTALDRVVFPIFEKKRLPGEASVTDPMLFNQIPIDRKAQVEEIMGGSGYWDERDEQANVKEGQTKIGNQVTFTAVEFSRSEPISRHYFADDQHNTVVKIVAKMARNGRRTRELKGFTNVFVNGFSTGTTHDGNSIFNNSHNLLDSGQTQDNLLTDKLNEDPLNDAITLLGEMFEEDGVFGELVPQCLLVPVKRFKGATELVESELQSTTANNAVNVFSLKYGIYVKQTPFLGSKNSEGDGGSDNLWFLLADRHEINRYIREDLTTDVVPYQYQSNNNYIYKAFYREIVGAPSWVGSVGSNGTTGTNL